jgi:hypothetical protein
MTGHGWLVLTTLFLFFHPDHAYAQTQDWVPEILPTKEVSYRESTEAIRIRLPEKLPDDVIQLLNLELDAIDVTPLAALENHTIVLTPAQPFTFGPHVLRLVEYATDGSVVERGIWNFEVRQAAAWQQAELAGNINLIASQRVADHGLESDPEENTGQGGANFTAALSDKKWKLNSTAALLYNSQEEQTVNGDALDMGEYLVTVATAATEMRLGHHALQQNNLILNNFNRRGLSGDLRMGNLNTTATGFVMRTDQVTGFENFSGINDSEQRVAGLTLNTQLLNKSPNALNLSLSYLTGEGSQEGVNVIADNDVSSGNAWSLVADSALVSQQLRLRGEYAGTEFDFDGEDTGSDAEDDNAYSLLAVYSPATTGTEASPSNWNIGIEHMKVDTFFRSLANTSLPSDRNMTRIFSGLSHVTWSIGVSFARETDNINDSPLIPTSESNYGTLTYAYNRAEPVSKGSSFSWFGTPSLSMVLGFNTQEHTDTPAAYTGSALDIRTDSLQMQSTFNHPTWNWGLGLGVSQFEDSEGLSPDSQTYLADLYAGFPIGTRVTVAPNIQYQETKDESSGDKQTAINWGAGASINFIPDKLAGNINFSVNQNELSGDSLTGMDTTTNIFSGDLVWHWIPPKTNRPGFDISLNGTWQDVDDRVTTALSSDSYQVFLNLIMTMPVAFPGGVQ